MVNIKDEGSIYLNNVVLDTQLTTNVCSHSTLAATSLTNSSPWLHLKKVSLLSYIKISTKIGSLPISLKLTLQPCRL